VRLSPRAAKRLRTALLSLVLGLGGVAATPSEGGAAASTANPDADTIADLAAACDGERDAAPAFQAALRCDCRRGGVPTDPAVRSRIREIEIGVNSTKCPTYCTGFQDSMGRILIE
jgi:hypothetical protein